MLARGESRRFGAGSKAAAPLAGRPLVEYPLQASAEVCERVVVVCKRDTLLPEPTGLVQSVGRPAELAEAEALSAAR